VEHGQRGVEGALGMVFEGGRYPERGHHRVAGKLLDRAAGALDLLGHGVVEAVEQRPRPLRVLRGAERSRTDQVGEDDRGDLPLAAREGVIDRSPRSSDRNARRWGAPLRTGHRS
jgi:hypothetical protein